MRGMKDYILDLNNEFLSIAEKLGYSELAAAKQIDVSKFNTKIKLVCSKKIFKSDIKKDRGLIESKKADIIYGFETLSRKDGFHFLNSGLNQVLAKLMKDRNVSYGISFSQLLNASKQEQSVMFGRIMQNLKLCKKYKVHVIAASFARNPYEMRDSKDMQAFARVLGLQGYK